MGYSGTILFPGHHTGRKKLKYMKLSTLKGKSKVVPAVLLTEYQAMKAYGKWRYNSTHYFTSALDLGEWSAPSFGRFTHQGKSTWYPLDRRLGRPQSRSGRSDEQKHSKPLPGLEPQVIQPVAQRCTAEPSWLPHFDCGLQKVTVPAEVWPVELTHWRQMLGQYHFEITSG
jgi:hypothetical protein